MAHTFPYPGYNKEAAIYMANLFRKRWWCHSARIVSGFSDGGNSVIVYVKKGAISQSPRGFRPIDEDLVRIQELVRAKYPEHWICLHEFPWLNAPPKKRAPGMKHNLHPSRRR